MSAADPETRRLLLLRHAKSSWKDASLPDAERPLNARGRRSCELLQAHLEAANVGADLVVCSTARRTVETLERIVSGFAGHPEISVDERVYHGRAADLLSIARETDEGTASLMLIGHNPAIGELARGLAGAGADLAQLRDKYATGALATISFAVPWPELGEGAGTLESYVRPKDLEASG